MNIESLKRERRGKRGGKMSRMGSGKRKVDKRVEEEGREE